MSARWKKNHHYRDRKRMRSSSTVEQSPVKREVTGSSPVSAGFTREYECGCIEPTRDNDDMDWGS